MKKGSSKALLLDVNVLVALAWPNHQFHVSATTRLQQGRTQWATCALTQLGFIRLSSMPAVVGVRRSPSEAALLLAGMVADSEHIYVGDLPAPVSGANLSGLERILGHSQVTDSYLVSLAEANRMTLLTFDTRIQAIARSPESIEVLGP